VSVRTIVVVFPNRKREFWFTDRVFSVNETVVHAGRSWVVTSIGYFGGHGGAQRSITVRPDLKLVSGV
jgi:hypothetical protein